MSPNTILNLDLTKEQLELCQMLINCFGDGQHPFADDKTINFFTIPYLKSIINKEEIVNTKHKQNKETLNTYNSIVQVLSRF